jgi:hypothetical protein
VWRPRLASAWTATSGRTVAPGIPGTGLSVRGYSHRQIKNGATSGAFVFGAAFVVVVVIILALTGAVLTK